MYRVYRQILVALLLVRKSMQSSPTYHRNFPLANTTTTTTMTTCVSSTQMMHQDTNQTSLAPGNTLDTFRFCFTAEPLTHIPSSAITSEVTNTITTTGWIFEASEGYGSSVTELISRGKSAASLTTASSSLDRMPQLENGPYMTSSCAKSFVLGSGNTVTGSIHDTIEYTAAIPTSSIASSSNGVQFGQTVTALIGDIPEHITTVSTRPTVLLTSSNRFQPVFSITSTTTGPLVTSVASTVEAPIRFTTILSFLTPRSRTTFILSNLEYSNAPFPSTREVPHYMPQIMNGLDPFLSIIASFPSDFTASTSAIHLPSPITDGSDSRLSTVASPPSSSTSGTSIIAVTPVANTRATTVVVASFTSRPPSSSEFGKVDSGRLPTTDTAIVTQISQTTSVITSHILTLDEPRTTRATTVITPGVNSPLHSSSGFGQNEVRKSFTTGTTSIPLTSRTDLVIESQTLVPDGPPITVSGVPYSLASDNSFVVAGQSSEFLESTTIAQVPSETASAVASESLFVYVASAMRSHGKGGAKFNGWSSYWRIFTGAVAVGVFGRLGI